MRRVVFPILFCLAVSPALVAQEASSQPAINKVANAKFITFPNLPDCATGAVQRGDPNTGPSVIFVKFEAGCAVPWHWHTPNEQVMVASGLLEIHVKGEQKPALLRRGDYAFMPSRHVHQARCMGSAACNFFLSADGAFDIHYVDEAGKEIPAEAVLKNLAKAAPPSKQR